jgi:hypothetical protein
MWIYVYSFVICIGLYLYVFATMCFVCWCIRIHLCAFTYIFRKHPTPFPTPYHYPVSLPSQAVAARDPDAGLGRRPKNMRCDTSNFDNIKGFAAQMLRLRGANVKASRPKCQGFEGGFSDAKLRGVLAPGGPLSPLIKQIPFPAPKPPSESLHQNPPQKRFGAQMLRLRGANVKASRPQC